MDMENDYEPLDWDLSERDRLIEDGTLLSDQDDPTEIAVGEDE